MVHQIESDEPGPECTGALHAATERPDALGEADAARRRRDQRVGSERIEAYAEAIRVIGDLLHPATAGDEMGPRRRSRLDPLLRGELELALRAMAADVRKLAIGNPQGDG